MGGFFTYRKLTKSRQTLLPTPTFTLQVGLVFYATSPYNVYLGTRDVGKLTVVLLNCSMNKTGADIS